MSVWCRVSLHLLIGLTAMTLLGCKSVQKREFGFADPVEEAPDAPGEIYTVKSGDTLFSIAERYDLAAEDIVEVNGLRNPDELLVGQTLFLPKDEGLAPRKAAPEPDPEPKVAMRQIPPGTIWAWPVDGGVLLREFSRKKKQPYDGLLVAAPQGTRVRVTNDGVVAYTGDPGTQYGTMIIVKHKGGFTSIYSHLDGVGVQTGQKIKRGRAIGNVGSSGRAESPRLHFEIREGRAPVNPLDLLEPKDDS